MLDHIQEFLLKTEGKADHTDRIKDLGDGTYAMIRPLLFHWMMIRGDFGDMLGYFDRWCYADEGLARAALDAFPLHPPSSYEPSGWHKHPGTRRHRPGGDPLREYTEA